MRTLFACTPMHRRTHVHAHAHTTKLSPLLQSLWVLLGSRAQAPSAAHARNSGLAGELWHVVVKENALPGISSFQPRGLTSFLFRSGKGWAYQV